MDTDPTRTPEGDDHDPEAAISGLNPRFAVDNRLNLSLHTLADLQTQWSYARMGEFDVEEMRLKARHLEEYAADLRAAIEQHVKDER
jgi:hypothetical protein